MAGQQQTTSPLPAEQTFHLSGYASIATSYLAGAFADRFGRKPVLLVGWLFALPPAGQRRCRAIHQRPTSSGASGAG